jgi:hypothetical protein
VTATAEEIRRQVKRYRLGERHLAADDGQGAGPMASPVSLNPLNPLSPSAPALPALAA